MKALIIFLLALLSLQGCASAPRVIAVPSENQKRDYNGGVVSQKKHIVSVSYYSNFKMQKSSGNKNVFFNTVVQNCGEKPFSISRDNISVMFKAYGNKAKPLYIKSADDFIHDINTTKRPPTLFRSNSSSTSDIFKTMEEDIAHNNKKRHERKVLKDSALKAILKPKTIIPDDATGGIIVCDAKGIGKRTRGNFIINILVDDEIHEFTFARII